MHVLFRTPIWVGIAGLFLLLAPAGLPRIAVAQIGETWGVQGCGPSTPVPAAEFLIQHMSRTLWDPVDPRRLGSLEPKLRAHVNGEIYRFATAGTLSRFRRDPVRWCGIVRDPVSGTCFVPDRCSPRLEWADGPYFFTCDSTRLDFSRAAGLYAIQRDYWTTERQLGS